METTKQQIADAMNRALIGKRFKKETVCARDHHLIDETTFVVCLVKFGGDYLTLQGTPTSSEGIVLSYTEAINLADHGTIFMEFGNGCRHSGCVCTLTEPAEEGN